LPTIERDLRAAAGAFFAVPYTCIPLGASSGFSGSAFARVETKDGTWCLRRWPAEIVPATLSFMHTVLRHNRSRGFSGVPGVAETATGETVACLGDIAFDAQEWISGASLAPTADEALPVPNPVCQLLPEQLVQVATALADFHGSTSDLSPPPSARRPSLATRIATMGRALERQRVTIEAWLDVEPSDELRDLAHAWLRLMPSAIEHAIAGSAPLAPLPVAGVAVHGDLWAPHVFFAGPSFSGFVDFESLAWDASAVDLAQLILHFNGWDERAAVLDAYSDHRPLTTTDHALLPAAAGRPPHRDRHIANLRALFPSFHTISGS
jgi:Ser/Thr protein kinase RdoA (MazF antagonist)